MLAYLGWHRPWTVMTLCVITIVLQGGMDVVDGTCHIAASVILIFTLGWQGGSLSVITVSIGLAV
jgi:hypothetical protein